MDFALGQILLRQLPAALKAGVTEERYKIFGSVIKNVQNGRIVGHLQEAAPLSKLLGGALNPLGAGASAVSNAASLIQGEVIRAGVARIERGVATLTAMELGNLAVSAAGIGVSVVGFTVVATKIDGLRREVVAMGDRLDQIGDRIDQLSRDIVDVDFVEVKALAKSYDEAWRLSGPAAEVRWQEVARSALSYQSRFEMRADRILQSGSDRYAIADPFLDAVSMTSGLRVAALAACNEVVAAQAAAADGARGIERLTGGIGLADLTRTERTTSEAKPGTTRWAYFQAKANQTAGSTVKRIRQREAAAATRAAPLADLVARGQTPRDWLEAARSEETAAFLFLPAQAE